MSKIERVVVVYPGRFQPWHIGHYNTYKATAEKFGSDDLFVGTSNKVDQVKSPFNFREKKKIIETMFPDLKGKVVQVKNPYAPKEIFKNYDPETTAFITVVSEKDSKRLAGKYFKPYKEGMSMDQMENLEVRGYVWVAEKDTESETFDGKIISGSMIREFMTSTEEENQKRSFFETLYGGKFNKRIFKMFTSKMIPEPIDEMSHMIAESVTSSYQHLDEGGAFGHLAHPYEEVTMTFGQMQNMIEDILDNKIEYNVEKTDGQNLMITYKNFELRAARNKTHLKNMGEKSLNIHELENMFAGRDEIQEAFFKAMADLTRAFDKLDHDDLIRIFEEGQNFMSLEIIFPKNTNVIPYGHSLLVFQGIVEHDMNGNPIGYSREDARDLYELIEDINAEIQDEFEIRMQPELELPQNIADLKKKYVPYLDSIRKEFNLSNSHQIKDYLTNRWMKYMDKLPFHLHNELRSALINRWVYDSKQPNIREIKKMGDESFADWVNQFEKKTLKKVQKKFREPFEMLFLELGADVLKQIKSVLTLNHQDSTEKMVKEIEKVINQVRKSNDPDHIEKVEHELAKVAKMGGFENLVPIEGIVFSKGDQLYKLTGMFAPVNQLLGILRYQR